MDKLLGLSGYAGTALEDVRTRTLASLAILAISATLLFSSQQSSIAPDLANWFVGVGAVLGSLAVVPFFCSVRKRKRVLLLRKFHIENRNVKGLAPIVWWAARKFSTIDLFHDLATFGFDVTTLRDSDAKGDDRSTYFGGALVGALVGAVASIVTLFIVDFVLESTGSSLEHVARENAWALPGMIVLLLGFMSASVLLAGNWSLRRQRGRQVPHERRMARWMKRPFQFGMSVVAVSDENWRRYMETLVEHVDVVCIDLRVPSVHCKEEIDFVRERNLSKKVLWLHCEHRIDLLMAAGPNRYSVMGVPFDGVPQTFLYPLAYAETFGNRVLGPLRKKTISDLVEGVLGVSRANASFPSPPLGS